MNEQEGNSMIGFLKRLDAETLKTELIEFLTQDEDNYEGSLCLEDLEVELVEFIQNDLERGDL